MNGGRGRFIVIEGIDGAGTTTQVARLRGWLGEHGVDCCTTREPSDGPVGTLIRQVLAHRLLGPDGGPRRFDWATMALLFAADRLDHVEHEVLPALERGSWVISDRYDLSSLAYQSATAPHDGVTPWIRELNSRALRPDLTLVIDVTADVAAARRGHRGGSEELFEKQELQRRLSEVYAQAEKLVPNDVLVHIDGAAELEEVSRRVERAVDALLRRPSPP